MPTLGGQALLGAFDRVRIINLRNRADRRAEVARQFTRLGLEIDGDRIAFHDACRPADPGKFPSIGARGCFTSHLDILKESQKSDWRNVLIIEDDLDFAASAETRLPSTLARLDTEPWSIFYGGYELEEELASTSPLSIGDPQLAIRTTHFVAFSRAAIHAAAPYLTRMEQRERGDPEGGPMHVDGAYNWLRRAHPELKTLLATPMLGHQRPSRTDIHALGLLDRAPGLRDLVTMARRVKRRMAVSAY